MAGRAFFVLQTGSIFSQKAGEHWEPVVSMPRAETTEREKERMVGRGRGMVDFSSSQENYSRSVPSMNIPFRIRLTFSQ